VTFLLTTFHLLTLLLCPALLNKRQVFAEGTRTPVALVNSAQDGDAGMSFGDRTFTVVQAILP
jgi:hypothetical protein